MHLFYQVIDGVGSAKTEPSVGSMANEPPLRLGGRRKWTGEGEYDACKCLGNPGVDRRC